MITHTLAIAILVLSTTFTGIVLFLSTVLRGVFNQLPVAAYHTFFTGVIHRGRRSILINSIVLLPIVLFILYLIAGNRDWVFIAGFLLYFTGSFVSSRVINGPRYNRLLTAGSDAEVQTLRKSINTGNVVRAAVSAAGVLTMSWSLL